MTRQRNEPGGHEHTSDVSPIGPDLPPAAIARRMFDDLRGQGMTPQQIRRIALALITTTDAIPTQSAK
jgi:hypothetical protein